MKGIREKVIHVEPGCQCLSQARWGSAPCLQECEYPSAPPGWRLLPPVYLLAPRAQPAACAVGKGLSRMCILIKGINRDVSESPLFNL